MNSANVNRTSERGAEPLAEARRLARLESPAELLERVGTSYGPTDWMCVEQDCIDSFAEVSGDRQWVHVDVERARKGPYGGTIAHGNLTLALLAPLSDRLIFVDSATSVVNYGYNRIRFLSPVAAGSRIRLRADLVAATRRVDGILATWGFTVEVEGVSSDRPALVAEKLQLFTT